MIITLLIVIILVLVFPPLRALILFLIVGLLSAIAYPIFWINGKVNSNTGEGKFMQKGQLPILVLLALTVPCILVAIFMALSQSW